MGCLKFIGKKFLFLIITSVICLTLSQCQKPYHEEFRAIKKWQINYEDTIGHRKRVKGNASEGHYYTTSNKTDEWTDCFVYVIPDSLFGKDLRILFNCNIRKCEHGSGQALIVHFTRVKDNSLLAWYGFEFDDYTQKINVWGSLRDSTQIHIPKKEGKDDRIELRVVGWNPAHYAFVDMDNLKIELKEVKTIYKKQDNF
jgi:hypothetical protein